jgi:glycine C-acetyltransferase
MTLVDTANSILDDIKLAGTWKGERPISSSQSNMVRATLENGQSREVVNFCANNYLGLANNRELIEAAKFALDSHGFGMASVRFICGTQDLHKDLERRTAQFLGMEDCIVFPSCFDANGGIFEPLLTADDAIISDSLNHASIIDGVRLCKAERHRYANNDMAELEEKLIATQHCNNRLIVTDGVFSMDGIIADLPTICSLAESYDAMIMVDDCHATGFLGSRGAGTPEFLGVEGRVHILTGTYGKALGGASGGYVAGPEAIIEVLRQRARPYLFSNAVAPSICAAAIKAIEIAEGANEARETLEANATRFRKGMEKAGFRLVDGNHPIIPVMIGDADLAGKVAEGLFHKGIYVVAFSYPVVPEGKARIRIQMSAIHTFEQIDACIAAFTEVGRESGLVS